MEFCSVASSISRHRVCRPVPRNVRFSKRATSVNFLGYFYYWWQCGHCIRGDDFLIPRPKLHLKQAKSSLHLLRNRYMRIEYSIIVFIGWKTRESVGAKERYQHTHILSFGTSAYKIKIWKEEGGGKKRATVKGENVHRRKKKKSIIQFHSLKIVNHDKSWKTSPRLLDC